MRQGLFATASLTALAMAVAAPQTASAQEDESGVGVFRDRILVTATKKADAEDVQEVPLAVTAYGADQLDALKVRDLANLSYAVPNVGLEDIGTSRGVANFSIRGLGVNSSIPSIDPAVGTFVDGVYLGQNAGVVLDIFDLESIEVLRGPQGILFGRNVTGGAVLINTKRPNLDEFEASFKGAVESGLRNTGNNYYAMGSVSGPLVEGVLAFKLSAYYNNDRGYHRRYLGGPNLEAALAASPVVTSPVPGPSLPLSFLQGFFGVPIATNAPDEFVNHGKAETWVVRPQLLWQPTDSVSLLVKYEHFDSEGDGPSSQNHPGFVQPPFNPMTMMTPSPVPNPNLLFSAPKDSFIFSIDEPGSYTAEADSVTAQLDIDVPFGDGTITNIFGWRDTFGTSVGDIDATPFWLFHSSAINDYEQISNEIRYAGRFFDALDLTVGFYYFSADHIYEENRFLLGGLSNRFGGGVQDSRNYGIFSQLEYDLTETFSLIGGVRYTNERKSADITAIVARAPCSTAAGECPIDFSESFTWKNVTPKVGVQWAPLDDLQVYAHWTQGVRSGGYNFRNTSSTAPIARFDEESVDSFEVGFKAQPADGKAVINFAAFVNKVDDMQREINLPDPAAGVVQLIRNSADATIFGIEIESRLFVTDNLMLTGNLGRLDGEYDEVFEDINSDGVINDTDLTLMIPRLSPWTYGAGFLHTFDIEGLGSVDTRFNWSHRDDTAYTDNNLGILNGADMVDASIALNLNGRATVSIYGQNLLHEVTHGGETQLPTFSLGGGTFAPLNKGRIVGIELQLDI